MELETANGSIMYTLMDSFDGEKAGHSFEMQFGAQKLW